MSIYSPAVITMQQRWPSVYSEPWHAAAGSLPPAANTLPTSQLRALSRPVQA